MRPYSNDLRRTIVAAYASHHYSQRAVAELFGVSLATVKNFLSRQRDTGSPDALPPGGGKRPALSEPGRAFVQRLVEHDNDLTLQELCRQVARRHRRQVSVATMCRVLQTLGLPRKKSRSMPANATRPAFSRPATPSSKS